jgi:very-short-patch-repair endonuclease
MDEGKASPRLACTLRRRATAAERLLWRHLQNRQLAACKFRRQAPIGPYVADFVCFAARLVIEVDGGQHAMQRPADMRRDRWFAAQGFRLMRFWNNEVLDNLDGVLKSIADALESTSHRAPLCPPSPSTGEGGERTRAG